MTRANRINKLVSAIEANYALASVVVLRRNAGSVSVESADPHALSAFRSLANRAGAASLVEVPNSVRANFSK